MSFKYQNKWPLFQTCGVRFLSEAISNLRYDISKDNRITTSLMNLIKSTEQSTTKPKIFAAQWSSLRDLLTASITASWLEDFWVCRLKFIDRSESTSMRMWVSSTRGNNITLLVIENTSKKPSRDWNFRWMIPRNVFLLEFH